MIRSLAIALALVSGPALAETPAFRSVETHLLGGNCAFVSSQRGAPGGDLKRCRGFGGYQPETLAEHTWVTLRIRTASGRSQDVSTIVRGYTVGTHIEWRLPATPLNARPFAAIVSVTPKNLDTLDPGDPVLAVIRLDGTKACMAAVVDTRATPNAPDLARQAADASGPFVCGRDPVATLGAATAWTRAVIDWPRP